MLWRLPLLVFPILTLTSLTLVQQPASAQTSPTNSTIQEGPQRLVVLPFRNLSRAAEDDWLGESFSESLTVALSQSRNLELVERSQLDLVMREQGFGQSAFADESSAPRLGRLLGARRMLVGSYQKLGSRLLVNARLVDVETGRVLGDQAVQLEGDYERLFSLQSQLAGQLLSHFGRKPDASSLAALEESLKICSSTAALEKYQKGLLLAREMSDMQMLEAIKLFETAIEKDPKFTLAYVALSEALSLRATQPFFYPSARAEDLPRALDFAEQALKHQDRPAAVYRALSRAYTARQQYDRAQTAIEESLRQKPGDTDSILAYLDLQGIRLGDIKQMREDLKRFEANTEDPWIQFSLAMVYLKYYKLHGQTDFSEVSALLQNVRRALPQYAFVPVKLAWIETLSNRYDEADRLLKEALQIDPNNYMIHYKTGYLLMNSPRHAASAEAHLKKSIELLPAFGHAEQQLGTLYLNQNRFEEARASLLRAHTQLPTSAATSMQLGLLAERQNQLSQAYSYLLQALDNSGKLQGENPERGRTRLHLSRVALKMNRASEAEAHARAAISERDITPSEAYQQLISLPLERGDYLAASNLFQEYQQTGAVLSDADKRLYQRIYLLEQLAARPNDAALLNDLGGLALVENRLAEASSFLERAAAAAPSQPAILFNLGLLRLTQQNHAAAATAFRQVLTQDPTHRKAAYNLGRALAALGDKPAARQTWEDLLARFPGDADALQALERL